MTEKNVLNLAGAICKCQTAAKSTKQTAEDTALEYTEPKFTIHLHAETGVTLSYLSQIQFWADNWQVTMKTHQSIRPQGWRRNIESHMKTKNICNILYG